MQYCDLSGMIPLKGIFSETVDVSLSKPEVIILLNLTKYCLRFV